jgi:restriction system protein
MPELVLVLAVVIGAIWAPVKILQGIGSVIEQVGKDIDAAAVKRKQNRYLKGRDNFRRYINAVVPNELDSFEREYEATCAKFNEAQALTRWVAHRPSWEHEKFRSCPRPRKDSSCKDMDIADLLAILTPNSDVSTWSYGEIETVNRKCKYPSTAPAARPSRFDAFPTQTAELKKAFFDADTAHVSNKDVEKFFAEEQNEVLMYNKRRSSVIEKVVSLNSAIEEWNRKNRAWWEEYIAELKRMEKAEMLAFQEAAELYTKACKDERDYFTRLLEGYGKGEKQSVVERLEFVLDRITFPSSIPHTWEIDFDEEQQIVVLDIGLPDVVHRPPYKTVVLKSGAVKKPLNQTERKDFIPKVHPAILLRVACEIFRNDAGEVIDLLVVNGWVKFDDPATGTNTKAYTASLMVNREQITGLKLDKIDPIVAFNALHGKSAGRLVEIIPIEPVLSLNRKDSRFVSAKEILKDLGSETNLAAMDWQDFEHLIRELFEKEFSGRGAEVKITQASRDRGVDAVVFDPDPIHGGKYVIQAKRYTHTVDVSAVRDLCAVVKKEGASRGILVTTSTYGADAYAFANNEPVTLLNGAELLGLLKKHGYAFRINLEEARRSV